MSINLDKIAEELIKSGDVMETEIIIKRKIDSGISVTVYSISFFGDGDYQYSSSHKNIILKD